MLRMIAFASLSLAASSCITPNITTGVISLDVKSLEAWYWQGEGLTLEIVSDDRGLANPRRYDYKSRAWIEGDVIQVELKAVPNLADPGIDYLRKNIQVFGLERKIYKVVDSLDGVELGTIDASKNGSADI